MLEDYELSVNLEVRDHGAEQDIRQNDVLVVHLHDA